MNQEQGLQCQKALQSSTEQDSGACGHWSIAIIRDQLEERANDKDQKRLAYTLRMLLWLL